MGIFSLEFCDKKKPCHHFVKGKATNEVTV